MDDRGVGGGTGWRWRQPLPGAILVVALVFVGWSGARVVEHLRTTAKSPGGITFVSTRRVDPAQEGKIVHLHGQAIPTAPLGDELLGVSAPVLHLHRVVEMLQWRETTDKAGDVHYAQEWASVPIDSGSFAQPEGHQNPTVLEVEPASWQAEDVRLGVFRIPDHQVELLQWPVEELAVTTLDGLPAELRGRATLVDGAVLVAADPAVPQVGDLRLRVTCVPSQEVSLIGLQRGDTVTDFRAGTGYGYRFVYRGKSPPYRRFAHQRRWRWIGDLSLLGIGVILVVLGVWASPPRPGRASAEPVPR